MNIKDFFLKFKAHKNPQEDKKSQQLRSEYNELLNRLSEIRSNFDFIDNPTSIDALIYEENATLCRLQELYREARERNMKLEAFSVDKK